MDEDIHISFSRSGGFGGVALKASFDVSRDAKQSPDSAEMILLTEQVMNLADEQGPQSPISRDGYTYELSIKMGARRRVIVATEDSSTVVIALCRYLEGLAKR
ncbi:MAG: hypothetical protein ABR507_03885 [Actinomycetota bacterium]|nr:hypothetical protein [Actinomycetota bacterium]